MEGKNRKLSFGGVEIRSFLDDDSGKKYVEGLIPYDSESLPMWGMKEIISRTAFKNTLANGDEVRALWNHDYTHVLGSTRSTTLTLKNSDAGLVCRCELPNTTYANDLYEIISRGDVTTMSFGFTARKCVYDFDKDTRTLKDVELHEVSFGVPFPAYPETTSEVYTRGFSKNKIDVLALNGILEKEEMTDGDRRTIESVINTLGTLIETREAGQEEGAAPEKADTETLELEIEAALIA